MGQSHGHSSGKHHAKANGRAHGDGHVPEETCGAESSRPNGDSQAAGRRRIDTLTSRQKFLILQTWDIAKNDMDRVGVSTFTEIFENHENLRNIFLSSWNISPDDLAIDDRLLSHGLRVLNIIGQVVDNLDNVEAVDKVLIGLGKRHVSYSVRPEMIPLIGIHFIASFKPLLEAEDLWTNEIQTCWSIIIDHVTETIMKCIQDTETAPGPDTKQD